MSSMRNAVQRRNHKERAQPQGREKWGILEKHKDYTLRARDFNEKKKRLKILRQKAADRNPDEFAFAMMSTKTLNGQKIGDRGNKALDLNEVKSLKAQDTAYLRTMLQRTRREIDKLKQEIRLAKTESGVTDMTFEEGQDNSKHTVFVQDRTSQRTFDAASYFETDEDGLSIAFNRPKIAEHKFSPDLSTGPAHRRSRSISRKALLAIEEAEQASLDADNRRSAQQASRMRRLEELRATELDLSRAETDLELQRARMSNSIGGTNKSGVKFKIRQRKR